MSLALSYISVVTKILKSYNKKIFFCCLVLYEVNYQTPQILNWHSVSLQCKTSSSMSHIIRVNNNPPATVTPSSIYTTLVVDSPLGWSTAPHLPSATTHWSPRAPIKPTCLWLWECAVFSQNIATYPAQLRALPGLLIVFPQNRFWKDTVTVSFIRFWDSLLTRDCCQLTALTMSCQWSSGIVSK